MFKLKPKESLQENGYTTLHHFVPSILLDEVEQALDDTVRSVDYQAAHIEINRPSRQVKQLLSSPVLLRCKAFAEDYFGKKCHCLFDQAEYKFGQCRVPTLWHQDQAYTGSDIPINSLNFWIPLQTTTPHNGSIRFLKDGPSHLLPHRKVMVRGTEQLAIELANRPAVHRTTLNKGDVTVHTNMAVHSTSINASPWVRKAWVIHFSPTPQFVKRMYQVRSQLFSDNAIQVLGNRHG